MQQRRGTAQQWTDADPRLESGEIGFETDTNQFKIGDGVNVWSDLSYFKNLEDLGGSLDDYALANLIGAANGIASLNDLGKIPSSQLPDALSFDAEVTNAVSTAMATEVSDRNTAIETARSNAISVASSDATTKADAATSTAANALSTHNSATTNVHGIANTAALATKAYVDNAAAAAVTGLVDGAPELLNTINELAAAIDDNAGFANTVLYSVDAAQSAAEAHAEEFTTNAIASEVAARNTAIGDHNQETTNVHGIANTAALALSADVATSIGTATQNITDAYTDAISNLAANVLSDYTDAISAHGSDTSNVHGIADTAALATKTYADAAATSAQGNAEATASSALSSHNSTTINVHGIANTAALATQSYADTAEADAITAAGLAADGKISNAVAALTKSSVGLANVDNTSDANKPISTATQTALNLKANLAGPTFTGTVTANNLVVDGDLTLNGNTFNASATTITIEDNMLQLAHQNAANTVDLGIVVAYNDGTAKHSGLVRDVSDAKWKLFQGVTTEPTTTVNFGQGSLDALAVGALEATTVTPSSGVVFSDGTQTLEGVPSRTVIIQRTASNTLSGVERDDLIEMASSSAMTLTIPTDSTFNFPIGTSMDVLQTSTGQVTIAGAGGVTVNATPGLKLRTQWSSATLFKRAANTWVVYGDLTA